MKVRLGELKPHPVNEEIYHDHADTDLIESIKEKGILIAPTVTFDNRIISGHRRIDAARRIYSSDYEIEVVVFPSRDELDILEAVIHSNKQRQRTPEQIGREVNKLAWVIGERTARAKAEIIQQQSLEKPRALNGGYAPIQVMTKPVITKQDTSRDTRVKVAAELGVARDFGTRAAKLVTVIDNLKANGKEREAEIVRTTMNKSVHSAYAKAVDDGYIQPRPKADPPTPEYITLIDWQSYDEVKKQWALTPRQNGKSQFNRQEDNSIEWALWSWNPISGCDTGCKYCYARDIANRFYPQKFVPTIYPNRLLSPSITSVPTDTASNTGLKNVFTVSMGDMFGKWVPEEWITAVMQSISDAPQWNFLILTKWPERLIGRTFPVNVWLGTTVDSQSRVIKAEDVFSQIKATVKFVSCEPLQEYIHFDSLSMFQWVIIGGRSKSAELPEYRPPREWIETIEHQARKDNCKIYEKQNLLERIKEYPVE